MMQGADQESSSELVASVRRWMAGWGDEVAGCQLERALSRFAPDVVAFGTRADVLRGRAALHDEQWSRVWPTIQDFRFDLDDLVVLLSDGADQAVAICGWHSTGFGADGSTFERPGRATIVLRRAGDGWVGVHTHFSLAGGVPTTSHGPGSASP